MAVDGSNNLWRSWNKDHVCGNQVTYLKFYPSSGISLEFTIGMVVVDHIGSRTRQHIPTDNYELQNICATANSLTCLVFPRKPQVHLMCWRSQMPECMNNITDFSKQDYSMPSISASRKSSSGQHETLFITSPLLKSLIALKLMLFPVLKHYCILQSLKL